MEFNATFLIASISFIVFVFIMNLIFYKPIEEIVQKREAFIDENFDEAKKNNIVSKKLTDAYDKKIAEANSKGKTILNEKSAEAKAKKDELILNAKNKAQKDIINNQNELDMAFNQTKDVLKSEIDNLANQISVKLFGSEASCNGGNR